jgi:hypothetical protein
VRCKGMASRVRHCSAKKYSCEVCYGYVQLVLKTKFVHNLANFLQFSMRRPTRQNSWGNFCFCKHSLKIFCLHKKIFWKVCKMFTVASGYERWGGLGDSPCTRRGEGRWV